MDIKYAYVGARVAYYNGVSDEYGTIHHFGSSPSDYVFVTFDHNSPPKACAPSTLALADGPNVEDTGDMTSLTDDVFDPTIRHNKFKDFETESEGKILTDEEIWQLGFDTALDLAREALATVWVYEQLGTPDVIAKNSRRADIMMEYIQDQPAPVRQAWKKHLAEKKAL